MIDGLGKSSMITIEWFSAKHLWFLNQSEYGIAIVWTKGLLLTAIEGGQPGSLPTKVYTVSQFATIPLLAFVNPTLSRRKGLTAMFLATSCFTLLQFLINPSDCLDCKTHSESLLMLVFFFAARFSINLASNFFVNSTNETFPAQVRGICILTMVGVGRLSTLLIPFVPKLK